MIVIGFPNKWRVAIALLFVFAFAPISFSQSSPGDTSADPTLQKRAKEFYGLLQAGRRSEAEPYVAPDSRERFRSSGQRNFFGFSIGTVKLEPQGKGATVEVRLVMMAPFAPRPITVPHTTHWRLIDAVWYLDLTESNSAVAAQHTPGGMGMDYTPPPEELKFPQREYSMGKLRVGDVGRVRVPFTNGTKHIVTIEDIHTACDCLIAKTDKQQYKPGEAGELSVQFDSTRYRWDYSQTIRVKTDPGDIVNKVTVTAFVDASPVATQETSGQKPVKPKNP